MSSAKLQAKTTSFVGAKVVNSTDVWDINPKTKKFRLREGVIGRVSRGSSAFVASVSKTGKQVSYLQDSSHLTMTQKTAILRKFENENKTVAYLVDPTVFKGVQGGARAITSGSSVVSHSGKKKTAGEGF